MVPWGLESQAGAAGGIGAVGWGVKHGAWCGRGHTQPASHDRAASQPANTRIHPPDKPSLALHTCSQHTHHPPPTPTSKPRSTHLQVLQQPRLVVVQVAQVHLHPQLAPAEALEQLRAVNVLPALAERADELAVCGVGGWVGWLEGADGEGQATMGVGYKQEDMERQGHQHIIPEAVARPLLLQRRVVRPVRPRPRVVVGVGVDHRDAGRIVPIHAG